MFSLLSGMWVYLFGIPQYNVLVLGLDNAGKSTFLYQVGTICARDRKKKQQTSENKSRHNKRMTPPNTPNQATKPLKPVLKRKTSDNPETNLYNHLDPKLRQILPTMGQNVKLMEFDNMTLQFWDLPGQSGFRKIWTHYYKEVHAIVFMVDSADANRLNESKYELHKLLNECDLQYAPVLVLANKQDLKQAVHYQQIINTLQIISLSESSLKENVNICNEEKDEQKLNSGVMSSIDETKQGYYNGNSGNTDLFKDRSMKVMCTCCLNKDGLSDAISWLVYTIPLAKRRFEHMTTQQKQMDTKKQ